jgi:hypothetical protein
MVPPRFHHDDTTFSPWCHHILSIQNHFIVLVYYQQNSCTTAAELGLEEPFKEEEKKTPAANVFISPYRSRARIP